MSTSSKSPSATPTASSKPAMSGPNSATAAAKQTPSKMHRRSRTGCFTCRLRRKKCDEGKSQCKACNHLGLKCEYKRPMWWSNNEQRRSHKEYIKNVIKRTKLNEKSAHAHALPLGTNTPPSLCHSSITADTFIEDHRARTRDGSMDSHFSLDAFNPQMLPQDLFAMPPLNAPFPQYSQFSPYEVDVKTETQMFINDIPTRRDSTISTFSTFQAPQSAPGLENWVQQESYFEHRQESFTEEPVDFNVFQFAHPASPHQSIIQVDECDQHLLNHFIEHVIRLIFPILAVNQHGSAPADVILPALESNKCYLHCCLSISALHLKSTQGITSEQIDQDIIRHKFAAISEMCEALNRDTLHSQTLEATLGMIFFHCSVGRPDDCLPDVPWHSHFQAATCLINKLDLPLQLATGGTTPPPFNMTVASWIDILGATMLCRAPIFADTYREKNVAGSAIGLAELMGCDDRIMFLISEIACLDALKADGMDTVQLCTHIKTLGDHITLTEVGAQAVGNAISATGAVRPKQLRANMTAVFRIAARIYLCSLVPGFDRATPNITALVASLADAMAYIPSGADGFDRSLVWPLLVAGAVSLPGSTFRGMFAERVVAMREAGEFGSFGRVREVLKAVWAANDEGAQWVHWREVMRVRGWDFLLL
ncbi:C6 sexual development transcription factor-like protein NosA [Trichodelitschia bisporula]|uniref:C6 sexual development transcription factor-like protein NosA n=1 Tax=Trichodelitschia bisporula TaxID=703511 RepID=A0A6G1IC26_9PEZI|nr:C6 sexual development transcription factor-like protein NosA [Trichodelitschia bisporula]